jgi:putative tryptophan/tyrosine transport system substrate-binding protein
MRRREFIGGLGSAVAWPLTARAQQPATPVIGYLSVSSAGDRRSIDALADFGRGLAETGYIAGRNVAIEYHWAEGRYEMLPTLVADLVRRRVAVIVIDGGTAAVFAAKTATQTIPIVFGIGSNPVEIGLVRSLNSPGGNLTSVTGLLAELGAKRLELLHELIPSATSIGFLVNPTNPAYAEAEINQVQGSARTIGVRLLINNASSPSEIETAFATFDQQQAEALLIGGDVYFDSQSDQIIALAARHRVPAIYPYVEEAVAGGLMSYGQKRGDGQQTHMVGVYTGRILKGEKPGDLPVVQPTKFEFVINLSTAKALGLTIPTNLLAVADEVIE